MEPINIEQVVKKWKLNDQENNWFADGSWVNISQNKNQIMEKCNLKFIFFLNNIFIKLKKIQH